MAFIDAKFSSILGEPTLPSEKIEEILSWIEAKEEEFRVLEDLSNVMELAKDIESLGLNEHKDRTSELYSIGYFTI